LWFSTLVREVQKDGTGGDARLRGDDPDARAVEAVPLEVKPRHLEDARLRVLFSGLPSLLWSRFHHEHVQ